MGIKQKIYLNAFLSILLAAVMFIYVIPTMADKLLALQDSHREQINKLRELNEQAKSLSKMNEDLTALKAMDVTPEDFFTSDATLVKEIKTIEEIAAKTNSVMSLSISGTADKAQAVKSASGLSQIPYSVTLQSTYPNIVNFVKYLENTYFITPIAGINISGNEDGTGVSAVILSNFYLYKPKAAVAGSTSETTTTNQEIK